MVNINPQAIQPLENLMRLAWKVEEKDPYTSGHLWRVSKFAYLVSTYLNWTSLDVAKVTLGAFLHDIGKMETPIQILNKPGALTDREYRVIKHHPTAGYRLTKHNPFAHLVLDSILHHHEHVDGRGYPDGLSGHHISKHAKLVSICDAFDAMTSQRPYRNPLSKDVALDEIDRNLDTQFDRPLGATFIELGKQGMFDSIILHSDEGIPLQHCPMCGPTVEVYRQQQVGDIAKCKVCSSQQIVSSVVPQQNSKWKESDAITDFISATIFQLPASAFDQEPFSELSSL
ncbi:HD domain-containing protein [Vibrio brasiliensis]|jgi:putative nucleotidyltransferase with HDIG domain|uniref:HD-GYP domain-containing protein n=1 Tax=Vibrio brasiliensis TaxID=170652 RepID=UPI001EFD139C|nr:HD domain-containing phosphohydrolase [Vibrio brasiliensis]MCG9752228.1 HD domain-containing protein [Vibrio brasiliensis]MCG9784073.1 HD domain-containing protein [Vibrio brasiliensis]